MSLKAAKRARIYSSGEDPIDLPRDITDQIYLYDPESAINLEPARISEIVRLMTGYRPPETDSRELLRGLVYEDYESAPFIKHPKLYPYLRKAICDRSIWIDLLLHNPTVDTLHELLTLGEITIADLQQIYRNADVFAFVGNFVSNACSKGDLSVINELDRLGFYLTDLQEVKLDIWSAYFNTLITTENRDVAAEFIRRLPDPNTFIRAISQSSIKERRGYVPYTVIEFIRLYPEHLNELMSGSILAGNYTIALHLYNSCEIPVREFSVLFPTELIRAAIRSGSLTERNGRGWTHALNNIVHLQDEILVEEILEACGVSKSWPFDIEESSAKTIERERRSTETKTLPGVNREMMRKLITKERVSLLNRIPSHMFIGVFLDENHASVDATNIAIKVERLPGLRADVRVVILRALYQERRCAWIKSRSQS